MLSNRLAFVALGIACIGAAAGGGYLATRQNAVPMPAAAQGRDAGAAPAADRGEPSGAGNRGRGRRFGRETVEPGCREQERRDFRACREACRSARARRRRTRPAHLVARREAPQALTSTWPTNAAQQPPALPVAPPPSTEIPPPAPRDDRGDRTAQEPVRAPEPPQKTFEELVISSGSVIGLQTENRITSETARVEDRVDARVVRDVKLGDRVAIPAGTRAIGTVMQVERGGKFKETAKLGVRFNTLVLADGTRVAINTETIIAVRRSAGQFAAPPKVGGGAVGRHDSRRDPRRSEGRGDRRRGRRGRRFGGRRQRRSPRGHAPRRHRR